MKNYSITNDDDEVLSWLSNASAFDPGEGKNDIIEFLNQNKGKE
jgi:hypothetical protein